MAELRAKKVEMERMEQQRAVSQVAYQRWLKTKQEEDLVLRKERDREREWRRLQEEEKRAAKRQAQETFNSWKQQKDSDTKFQKEVQQERELMLFTPFRST